MFRFALIVPFALPLLQIGCSTNKPSDVVPFDTFQACWDDHHVNEGFTVQRAIEICCIDHPIGRTAQNKVCGETDAACQTYVTANLSPGSATAAEVMTACGDYILDRAP